MNFEAHNHFMNNAAAIVAEYGRVSFDVCVYLAWRANADTGACYPSRQTIADDIGCTLKAVKMALPKLKNARLLDWKADGRGSNHYTFPCVNCDTKAAQGDHRPIKTRKQRNRVTIDEIRKIVNEYGKPLVYADRIWREFEDYNWCDHDGNPINDIRAYIIKRLIPFIDSLEAQGYFSN